MNVLIVANGEPPSATLVRELAGQVDFVVAADGGLYKARDSGVEPDVTVGDLDSLRENDWEMLAQGRLIYAPDPDHTDLEKSIAYAVERGGTDILVAGALGGRPDHAVANLSVLNLFREQARVRLIDDWFEIEAIERETRFEAEPGTVVSLIAPGGCLGVTTEGLRWPLVDADLPFSPLGVHNVVDTSPVTVRVREGNLLVYRGRWIEDHRS